jgi:DNA-binding GntR family transcriptional regulator
MSTINETLSERIFEKLKDSILTGVYRPGNRLLYKQLSEEYKVSMTPIREALIKLEQEGIVKTIPRKGAYIIELTDQDVLEYTRIRFAMEVLAIEQICEKRIPQDEIRRLEGINADLEAAVKERESLRCIAKDVEFHHKIVEICGNQRLFTLIKQLPLTNFYAVRRNENRMVENGVAIVGQHQGIIDGLCNYDAVAATFCLKENILVPQLTIVYGKRKTGDTILREAVAT